MMESKVNIKGEVNFEDMTSRNVLEKRNVQNMSGGTPNVLNKSFLIGSNAAPIDVTDFLNGSPGQRLYILGDGQMTIVNGTFIYTNTGANKLLATNKVYRFTFFPIEGPPRSHKWVEDS